MRCPLQAPGIGADSQELFQTAYLRNALHVLGQPQSHLDCQGVKVSRAGALSISYFTVKDWGFMFPNCGNRYTQYARSKLCNVLHALEMQRRFAAEGTAITAHAVSPGRVNTGIFDNLPALAKFLLKPLASTLFQTPKQASRGSE